ncbi:hypothetical protein [Streptomyces sp. NBC_00690]|nr:hypothetical protein [Streptomyces sp. NBC_00690]
MTTVLSAVLVAAVAVVGFGSSAQAKSAGDKKVEVIKGVVTPDA